MNKITIYADYYSMMCRIKEILDNFDECTRNNEKSFHDMCEVMATGVGELNFLYSEFEHAEVEQFV